MKVRDVLKMLRSDGWFLRNQEGSHRQFIHPGKPGKVTVAGLLIAKKLRRAVVQDKGMENSCRSETRLSRRYWFV